MNKLLLIVLVAFALTTIACGQFTRPIDCNKPNEEYQCGSACQTTCQNLGKPCQIVNIRCNDACYCKRGYARDSQGHCIPVGQCGKYNK